MKPCSFSGMLLTLSLIICSFTITNASSAINDNEFAEFEVTDEPNAGPSKEFEANIPFEKEDDDKIAANVIREAQESESVNEEKTNLDEFPFLTDEEDFENLQQKQAENTEQDGSPANKPTEITPLTFANIPSHFRSNWSSYQVETIAIVVILLYVANYIYGKSINYSIAEKWFFTNRGKFEAQFALVGDDGISTEDMGGHLVKETDYSYLIWSTGRIGCTGIHTQIKLRKRQDLMDVAMNLIRHRPDRIVHKITLDPGEMDSFVIIFGQRKGVQKAVKEMNDLAAYVTERKNLDKVIQLPNGISIYAEIAETIPAIIDTATLQFLKKSEECVEYIQISDQYSGTKQNEEQYTRIPDAHPTLVFSYLINPNNADSDKMDELLLNFMFYMLEKVRRYRLSKEGKNKADKKRQHVQENFLKLTHQQRQEAAQTRREEKTRERKQRVMEEEDPDRQKRLEKIEQKRDAKQKQPKIKQFKIK